MNWFYIVGDYYMEGGYRRRDMVEYIHMYCVYKVCLVEKNGFFFNRRIV